jgi:hypothetical protein
MIVPAQLTLAASLLTATPLAAPAPPQDTTSLEFAGFRPGARLDELEALAHRARGRLRCARAKADPRVSECRASVTDSALGGPIRLWISAMDSVAGVITLSAPLVPARLEQWRLSLERRFGRVQTQTQGNQRMMQWVRRGRMLRLTWRTERDGITASVSLVDGRVLDTWGRDRAAVRSP